MPLYEYECEKCGHRFEKIQKFSDKMVKKCPECGGKVEQMISAPAVQFKGSGWYVTDYGNKANTHASSDSGGGDEKKDGSKKEDSKKEEKPKTGSSAKESAAKESSAPQNSSKDGSSKEKSGKEGSAKEGSPRKPEKRR